MSLKLSEEDIIQIVSYRIPPYVEGLDLPFTYDSFLAAMLVKINAEESRLECLIHMTDEGFLFVFAHHIDRTEEDLKFQYFLFEDVQGIKVRNRPNHYIVTFQLKDGRRYEFWVFKKYRKRYPNQKAYSSQLIADLKAKNLDDMDHHLHKKNKWRERGSGFLYGSTLFAFMIIPMVLFPDAIFGHGKGVAYLYAFVILAVHFGIYVGLSMLFGSRKDKAFLKEYNAIVNDYQTHGDIQRCIEDVKAMKNEPKSDFQKAQFKLSFADLYMIAEDYEQAEKLLEEIESTNNSILNGKRYLLQVIEDERAKA